MDVQSPEHFERLRDQPEFKAALLRSWLASDADEARFERARKNALYWPPLEALNARFLAAGRAEELDEKTEFYGRPCRVISVFLAPSPNAAYALAVVSAEGAPLAELQALLRDVCHDYWHGSSFFK